MGRIRRLLEIPPTYAAIAWWGLVSPLREGEVPTIHQAVVRGPEGVLLTVRADLRGWELPGGSAHPGESGEDAVRREVREETGLDVAVARHVGDYHRSGFRPHVARVHECRVRGGALRPSPETPRLGWFAPTALPATLFPWYRGPLADALAELPEPVVRRERQGAASVLSGLAIDLAMRWRG